MKFDVLIFMKKKNDKNLMLLDVQIIFPQINYTLISDLYEY